MNNDIIIFISALITLGYFIFLLVYVIIIACRLAEISSESHKQTQLLQSLVRLISQE